LISIEGVISESPIKLVNALIGNVTAGAVSQLGGFGGTLASAAIGVGLGVVGGALLSDGDSGTRVQSNYERMLGLQTNAIPLQIVTGLRLYTNMIMTSLTVNRTATIGKSLQFSCSFQQVRFVESESVPVPEKKVKVSGAATKQSLGQKTKKALTEGEETKSSSFLVRLVG